MIDPFGRSISYLRLSVTDRCDLRCRYCMAEQMVFLPKSEILTIEELVALADIFIGRGVNRIRLTGGEPGFRPEMPIDQGHRSLCTALEDREPGCACPERARDDDQITGAGAVTEVAERFAIITFTGAAKIKDTARKKP